MVQIKVYDAAGSQFWLDTYKELPLKMTLAIEDIEDVSAMSSFSRTFRIPGTKANYEYFKTMFLVEGQDFDVTRKAKAQILYNGALFSIGHIRVQKVFVNHSNNKYEYEISFMGETRDFASELADKAMCNLQIPNLAHNFDQQAVEDSWQAYPEGADGDTGLKNGNVLYPLIDFGNTYPGTGANQNATGEPRIAIGHPAADGGSFDNSNKPIDFTRFKPMIRAKCLIDQIFYDSEYTYTSNFLGEMEDPNTGDPSTSLFKKIYVSAFGNDESIYVDAAIGSSNTFEAEGIHPQGAAEFLECPAEISDAGGNYNPVTSTYTAPGTLPTPTTPSTLTLTFNASASIQPAIGSYGVVESPPVSLILWRAAYDPNTGTVGAFTPTAYASNVTDNGTCNLIATGIFQPGDQFRVFITPIGGGGTYSEDPMTGGQEFSCPGASVGDFNPIAYMDCEYKQIDFVRDLLTTFRLVMAPNPAKPRDFIIEPAQNYYRTGTQRDWSSKLDNDKDQVITPLFYTQTDQINYRHEEDEDYINAYHREVYKENYGYLQFDSGNELLKGTREITTKWAPTPVTQIEGVPIGTSTLEPSDPSYSPGSNFIIPQIHTRSAEPDGTQFLPIKAKTRWVFYNGLQDLTGSSYSWYLGSTPQVATEQFEWPLVTNSSDWPLTQNGQILNWFNDIGYWGTAVPGFQTQLGQSMYSTYWRNFTLNTYDTYARRLTATFVLDPTDLIDLQFSDTIFVNGTWYRPEKIIDYKVGTKSKVKCQLIKIIPAYKPFYTPVVCNMLLSQQAATPNAACLATGSNPVTYTSNVNLAVGDVTSQSVASALGGHGFFRVIANDCDPTTVGKILELSPLSYTTSDVVAILDPCSIPAYFYDATYCSGYTPVVVQSSFNNLVNGAIMKTENGICVTIGGTTEDLPTEILDDQVSYATCADCLPPLRFTYEVERCDNSATLIAESGLSNWAMGTIAKLTNGTCVEIVATSTANPTFTLDDTASYASCADCVPAGQSWNCVNGMCTDPGDGTGTYATMTECRLVCNAPPPSGIEYQAYRCSDNQIVYVQSSSTFQPNIHDIVYWGGGGSDANQKGELIYQLPTTGNGYPTMLGPSMCRAII